MITQFKATDARGFQVADMAARLSGPMRDALISAQTTPYGVATVIGQRRTLDALRRRGLIADDNRWTVLGREVADIVRGGIEDRGHVRLIDELHADALAEDAYRGELKTELRKFADGAAPYPYVRVNDGEPETRTVAVDDAHAEALNEDVDREVRLTLEAAEDEDRWRHGSILDAHAAALELEARSAEYRSQMSAWMLRHRLTVASPRQLLAARRRDHAEALKMNAEKATKALIGLQVWFATGAYPSLGSVCHVVASVPPRNAHAFDGRPWVVLKRLGGSVPIAVAMEDLELMNGTNLARAFATGAVR